MALFQRHKVVRSERGASRHKLDADLVLLEDTWSSSKFGNTQEEYRTHEAATEQFFNQSIARNSQVQDSQSSSRRPVPFLSHDGHNSPEGELFPPHAGFRRAQAGVNRVGATAGSVHQQRAPAAQNTAYQEPEEPLTEEEQRALLFLQGPPPGMPAHLLREEDRKDLEQRLSQRVSSVDKGRQNAVCRPVTARAPVSAAPKSKTKDHLHQLRQPSGVSKPRPAAATNTYVAGNTARLELAPTNSVAGQGNNGYLPSGQRRFPPLRLSTEDFRMLRNSALRHKGRVPFAEGRGMPAYGILRAIAPGHLAVLPDKSSSFQMRSHGLPADHGRGSMRPASNYGVNNQQLPSFQQQRVQQVPLASNRRAPSFGDTLATPVPRLPVAYGTSNSIGSNQPFNQALDPAILEEYDLDNFPLDFLDGDDPFGPHRAFMAQLPPNFSSAPQPISQPTYQPVRPPTIPKPTPASSSNHASPAMTRNSHSRRQQTPLPRLQQQHSSQYPIAALNSSLPSFSQQAGSSRANAMVVPDDDGDDWDMGMGMGSGDAAMGFGGADSNTATNNGNATTTANTNANPGENLGEPVYASTNGVLLGHFLNGKFVRIGAQKEASTDTAAGAASTTNAATAATYAPAVVPPNPKPTANPTATATTTAHESLSDLPDFTISDFIDFTGGASTSNEDKENDDSTTTTVPHPVSQSQTPPITDEDQQTSSAEDPATRTLDSYLVPQPASVSGFSVPFLLSHWDMDVSRRAMMRAGKGGRFLDEEEAVEEGGEEQQEKEKGKQREERIGGEGGGLAGAGTGVDTGEGEAGKPVSYEEQTAQWLRGIEGGEEGAQEDDLF